MKHAPKYFIGLLVVIFFRLIPHPPNVEPIMATMMPFAKKWGKIAGGLFAALTIILLDIITGTLGWHSLFTISAYGILGVAAHWYLQNRNSRLHYIGFAAVGTLFYDAITGLGVGMLLFKQTFMHTLILQIPFTLAHLAGNIVFATIVSPILFTYILENKNLELQRLFSWFSSRTD